MDLEVCNPKEIYGGKTPNCTGKAVFDHYTGLCVPATLIQFEDEENDPWMRFLYGVILPVFSLIVVLSNSIVILVLNQQKTKRASVEPLLWMAISSLLMALSPLPFTIYYYNLSHFEDFNQTIFLCYLQKVCMEILPFFFNTLVTFFTLLLGIQRFVAVQYPLQALKRCSTSYIRKYSKMILLFSFLLTGVHSIYDIRLIYHFCIKYGDRSYWVARCFIGHSTLTTLMGAQTFASIFDYFRLALVIVPSVCLFIVTILLIQTIRTKKYADLNISGRRHNNFVSKKTTTMLTVIIVLFMLARAPSTFLIVTMKLTQYFHMPHGSLDWVQNVYWRVLANVAVIFFHPLSFASYMFMSRKFRVSLRKLLGFKFLSSDEEYFAFTSSSKLVKKNSFNVKSTSKTSVPSTRRKTLDVVWNSSPRSDRRSTETTVSSTAPERKRTLSRKESNTVFINDF